MTFFPHEKEGIAAPSACQHLIMDPTRVPTSG
jgi:hypothetical protein